MYLDGVQPCWDGLSRVTGEKFSSLFFRIGLFKNFHKKIFNSYVLPQWYGKHRISGRINTVFHRVTPNHHLFPPGQEGSTPFSTGSGRFNTCLLPCQLFCPFLLPDHFRVNSVWIFPYEWGRTYHPFLFATKNYFQASKSLNLQKYSFWNFRKFKWILKKDSNLYSKYGILVHFFHTFGHCPGFSRGWSCQMAGMLSSRPLSLYIIPYTFNLFFLITMIGPTRNGSLRPQVRGTLSYQCATLTWVYPNFVYIYFTFLIKVM